MKLVMRRSLFAAGGLGGVMHFLNAQQTRKVRGILASSILGVLTTCQCKVHLYCQSCVMKVHELNKLGSYHNEDSRKKKFSNFR